MSHSLLYLTDDESAYGESLNEGIHDENGCTTSCNVSDVDGVLTVRVLMKVLAMRAMMIPTL